MQGHRRRRRELELPADHRRGNFILTLTRSGSRREDLPFFIALMDHLAHQGVACPMPVRAATATRCGVCGRPAAIVTFLTGMWPRRIDAVPLRWAGGAWPRCIGRRRSRSADQRLGVDRLAPALCGQRATRPTNCSPVWPANSARSSLPSKRPGRVPAERRDPRRSVSRQCLLPGPEVSGIIDFYFACNDFLAYDLAVCLNAWCFEPDGSFNVTKARLLVAAYQAVRPL